MMTYYYVYFIIGLIISCLCLIVMKPSEEQKASLRKIENEKVQERLIDLEEMWKTVEAMPAIAYISCFIVAFIWPIFMIAAFVMPLKE